MKKPCSTCPFRKDAKEIGAPDWIKDVINLAPEAGHTCHETDPKADLYKAGKPQQCAGFKMMRMNERLGGSAYAEVFKSTRDCVTYHALPIFEEGEKRGILNGVARQALIKIRLENGPR